jgi:Ca2+/Na+ antiporter
MINKPKLIMFIIATLLFILTITLPRVDHTTLIIMYVIFVLVGLYDLGVSEEEREEKERQSK